MPKEMSAAEYTKKVYEESPYKDKARDSDMRNKLNAMTNTAGAGRGKQGGPTAKQLESQNTPAWVNEAKQAAKDAEDQPKLDEAYEKSRTTFAQGGSASARADGCCQRGKTRGKMV